MKHTSLKAITLTLEGILLNINKVIIEEMTKQAKMIGVTLDSNFFDIYLEGGYEQHHRAKIHYHLLDPFLDGFTKQIHKTILEKAKNHQLVVPQDLDLLLNLIKKNNLQLGIISSFNKETTQMLLSYLPYPLHFDVLICGNEVLEGKPEANIYQKLLKQFGYTSDQVLALETTVNGVCSSYLANIETYFIELNQLRKEKSQKFSNRQLSSLQQAIELI